MQKISADWEELLALFLANKVEFLIVGGIAVSAHGYSRYTKYIDIWVKPTDTNAAKIIQAFQAFYESDIGFKLEQFNQPKLLTKIGKEPFRVDILTSIAGVDFADCCQRRVNVKLGAIEVPFISRADLILAKKASGRPQDLADIEYLNKRA